MYIKFLLILFILFFTLSCHKLEEVVIIYTSVDQAFSSQILKEFEQKTGIHVKAIYDTEASKAVGLEKRLLAEKAHPKADIFWSSENLRIVRLDAEDMLLEQHDKRVAYIDLNTSTMSQRGHWFGMGLRARVFIVNTTLMTSSDYPCKLSDLSDPEYKGKIAISNPLFGSASAQFAALYTKWGEKKFIHFLQALKANDVAFLAGNSTVKSAVGRGEYNIGLVDTDDALIGIQQGLPLKMLYYDQDEEGMFATYQTLGILKNSPHPKMAKKLFDYLLTVSTEKRLIKMHAVQFPLLSKSTLHHRPLLWTPSAERVAASLKASSDLIRQYLND